MCLSETVTVGLRAFVLQFAILGNHQSGRDSHIRLIAIHSPLVGKDRCYF